MVVTNALQLPVPFLTRYLIDNVIPMKNYSLLNVIGIVIFISLVLRAVLYYYEIFLRTIFRAKVIFDIRAKLYDHIQKLSMSFFRKQKSGYLMSRIASDVQSLQGLLSDTILAFCQSILTFAVGIAGTVYIHPKLAIFTIASLPLYGFVLFLFNKRIRKMSWELREAHACIQRDLMEFISGIFVIQSFSAEAWARLNLMKTAKTAMDQDIKLSVFNNLLIIISSFITSLVPLIVVWYGGAEIIKGNLSIGGLIAFNAFLRYLFGPVNTFVNLNLSFQRSIASAERIFEMFDISPEVGNVEGPVHFESIKGGVEFRNVNFTYDDKPVLCDVNFCVEPGETIAVVGPSGAGKSTLLNLVARFFDPGTGEIIVDGVDIRKMAIQSLRKNISIVSQDVFLFSATIEENIVLGMDVLKNTDIIMAAKDACAHEFIEKLPQQYNTEIGERGATLSGGERQRLAIARAVVRAPDILILDEATSQLDSELEKNILLNLKTRMKGKTLFIITHNLPAVANAGRIIVVDKGTIIAAGQHPVLYEECLLYKKLYDISVSETNIKDN